jgi:cell wall-associated NlpC family hydrolase
MKELLLALLVVPLGLMLVLSDGLAKLSAPAVGAIPPTPVALSVRVPATPVPTIAPVQPGGPVETLLSAAMSWLGVRYLWGGCDRRGVDCSCLMRNLFAAIGVQLPRTTVQQIAVATPISAEQARLGDLVFFDNTCSNCGANPTHVALVIAPGTMIDAGDPVRIEPIYGGHNAKYGRVLR